MESPSTAAVIMFFMMDGPAISCRKFLFSRQRNRKEDHILNDQTNSKPRTGTEFIFSVLLFLVFLLCSVFTILIGSRVYENIRARDDQTFYSDTVLAYVTNKVRQSDLADSVTIRQEDGRQILVLTTEEMGSSYETWIYTFDGKLKELFSEKGSGLTTSDGLDIMECPSLSFSLSETVSGRQLLSVTLGGSRTASLLLRSSRREGAAS